MNALGPGAGASYGVSGGACYKRFVVRLFRLGNLCGQRENGPEVGSDFFRDFLSFFCESQVQCLQLVAAFVVTD